MLSVLSCLYVSLLQIMFDLLDLQKEVLYDSISHYLNYMTFVIPEKAMMNYKISVGDGF